MAPEAKQARKIVWDGIDKGGRRMIDQAFPPGMREGRPNDQEMKIRFKNGSMWQVVGSDNYDSLVGPNPVGVVFSEYSVGNPVAWDYIRPILAENGGWAIFPYTPRGNNHGSDLYDLAKSDDDWYCERLTVDDTGVISQEAIDKERRSGMSDEMIQQEFYCSFEGVQQGSYYGKEMQAAEDDNRITRVPHDPLLKVHTAWDLGVGDATAIWFIQQYGRELRVIDYYEASGEGLPHYARVLQEKGYLYGEHIAPHDINVRELGSGMSRMEVAKDLGIKFRVAPQVGVDDGIEAVRGILPRCWFDSERCKPGINALRSYRKAWDEKRACFQTRPWHDWASHGADAMRYYAVSSRILEDKKTTRQPLVMPSMGIA